MIKPYTAVGLIPTVRGIRKREDIQINLEHLSPPGEGGRRGCRASTCRSA